MGDEEIFLNIKNFSIKLLELAVSTYVHNWSLQPLSQKYNLASHTIHVC